MDESQQTISPRAPGFDLAPARFLAVLVLLGLVFVTTSWADGGSAPGTVGHSHVDQPAASPPAGSVGGEEEPKQLLTPQPDAPWRAEAKRRSHTAIAIFAAEQVVILAVLAWLAFSGVAARWRDAFHGRFSRRLVREALFVALFVSILFAVGLPFDVARYALSRSYGIAQQPPIAWFGDHLLGFVVGAAFLVPVGVLFYRLAAWRRRTWWLWVSAIAVPISVLLMAAAPIYMTLFNTFTPLQDRPLAARILEIARQREIPADEVYEVDLSRQSRAANAFVTGIGPTATIALGDTLLDNFSDQETVFVMAHEMGHYVHHHIWIGLAAAALLTAVGAWLLHLLTSTVTTRFGARLGYDHVSNIASVPLLLLAISVLNLLGLPVGNTISRQIEIDADRFALELTVPDDVPPEAAISTFERLGRLALSDPDPNPILRFVLWSHPPLDERIRMVREARPPAEATSCPDPRGRDTTSRVSNFRKVHQRER